MTLPALIANHNKKVIETRLKAFYSTMNQAIVRAEADLGDKKYWLLERSDNCKADAYSEACIREVYDTYLKKYLNTHKVVYRSEFCDVSNRSGSLWIYFSNGSGVKIGSLGRDYFFYPVASKMDKKDRVYCRAYFSFGLYPNTTNQSMKEVHGNKGIEPYVSSSWDGTRDWLVQHKSCTKLIQLNNWEIPEDYPVKL